MFNRFAIDKTVTTGDLRFHYRDWGGRGWPVVLLHGLASTSHSWDLVAPLLVEHARVIALDLRGHGLSDKPDEGYDFETLSADVFEIASQLIVHTDARDGLSSGVLANIAMPSPTAS